MDRIEDSKIVLKSSLYVPPRERVVILLICEIGSCELR